MTYRSTDLPWAMSARLFTFTGAAKASWSSSPRSMEGLLLSPKFRPAKFAVWREMKSITPGPWIRLRADGNFVRAMRWIAMTLSRDNLCHVMDQCYPPYKAETEPRFTEINRGISNDEFCGALELARAARLWRFDTRWSRRRGMIPHDAPVWLPSMGRRHISGMS